MRVMARRVVRCAVGLIRGAAAAVVELAGTVLAGLLPLLVVAWPRPRRAVLRPVLACARKMASRMAQGHTHAAVARRLRLSQSAVEKHTDAIFDKLEPAGGGEGYSGRVPAVLRYLGG